MRRTAFLILVVLALALGAIIFLYTLRNERPPIPADQVHLPLRGARPEQCLKCHGPGGSSPRPPRHPLGKECLACHHWEGEPS